MLRRTIPLIRINDYLVIHKVPTYIEKAGIETASIVLFDSPPGSFNQFSQ